ncbi:unnamed protein product [Effrenium voratum]|nr:unnamed protein product [Effrenium voratum]
MAAHERRFRVLLAIALSADLCRLLVGSVPLEGPGVKMGSLRFDPPQLDFKEEFTCFPHQEKVLVYCDGCHELLSVEAVASDTEDIIPGLTPRKKKKGKASAIAALHVLFIAHQPGEVRGRIAVSTTAGVINYEVKGRAVANPYRIEAIQNSKVSGGEVMHHPLSVYNPSSSVMQISQVSTNDTFFQLLAPGEFRQAGHKRTPAGFSSILPERAGAAWTIQPQETSIVGYAKINLSPGKYRGFVEMKLDDVTSRILVPVSLGVIKVTGIKISPEVVDFQTLVSAIQARSIWLSVTNLNPQPIQLLSLFDPTQNPNLQISGFDHKKGISVASGAVVRFAKVTYHGSREGAVNGKLQLIVNDTDAVSATLDVPYKANVLYGSLGFMNDKTKFLSTPGRVTSTMRAIMVSNNFSVPIIIKSAKIEDPSFKISHFKPDTILQPGEAASLMHLEYTSNGSSALCTRDLELATNVTAMKIPLQVYHGNLHCQVEHGELQECGEAASSLDLNMGILSVSEARRSRLNITNLNPVNVTIESFSFSHPSVSLHMDGIYNPQGVQIRGSRPIPKQAHMKKVLTLQAGHRLALTLEVLAQEPTAGGPPVNASVQLVTKRGEKITIRTRYESVLGGLSFSPASLRFEASFPGQIQSRVVAARSTFEQPLQLDAVRSTDSRIIPELLTKTLKPLARTEVVRVYYDPAKATASPAPGPGAFGEDSREPFTASESGEVVHWNSPLTLDFLERWMARQKSVTSNGRGTSDIEATLMFDTNIVWGATLQVQASLMHPHALFEPSLVFDLTQVGASKARWLLAQNPSESPLALQLVFPVCTAAKSRGRMPENQTPSLQDGTMNLAADCEGGRAFRLGAEAEGKIWHVEPYGEASIGPILFEPFQHAQYRTKLYVRNNLTALHQVELKGHGGSSRLVFPEGVLEFNLTLSDFGGDEAAGLNFTTLAASRLNESDLSGESSDWLLSKTSNERHDGSGEDYKLSRPYWRQQRVAVKRSIVATNDCELPVEVTQINIGGIPGCSAFGFEVVDCQLPLTVAPHESVVFLVSFTPEVVASRWAQNLRFLSSSGRTILQVPLRVNLQPELLPMLSDLPTSLQILGDQTEASLRKAVVGTAFTVLLMMLAVVAVDSFRAWKKPVSGQLTGKLFSNGSAPDAYGATAARIGAVVSMLSWTSIDTLAGVQEKEVVQRQSTHAQEEPAQPSQPTASAPPAQPAPAQVQQAQAQSQPSGGAREASQQDQLKEQQQQLQQQLQQLQHLQQLQQQHLQQHLQQTKVPEAAPKATATAKAQPKTQPQPQLPKGQPAAKQPAKPPRDVKAQKEQEAKAPPSAPKGAAPAKAPSPTQAAERRPSQSTPKEDKKKKEREMESPHAKGQASQSGQGQASRHEERKQEEPKERKQEEAKKEKRPEDGPKKKEQPKAKRPEPEKSPAVAKIPPSHPPSAPAPPPEKKVPAQTPAQPPLQPPTLPPAQPPTQLQSQPAVPLNSVWVDKSPRTEFMGQPVQPGQAVPAEEIAMALPPPPSIPPPPAPGKASKPKAISPSMPGMLGLPDMRGPPGIDLGLLLTGPAPGLSPQPGPGPVLPPPGIAKPYPDPSLAPAEAAAVSAVQGLTDSFFATGLDFGGLGAIGLPPGIASQPMLPQRPTSSVPMDQEYYPSLEPLDRMGMFSEPPATSSLFSSPFGMFGPIGSHSYGDGNPEGNDFLSDLRSDSRRNG